jgi:hypothetical protein
VSSGDTRNKVLTFKKKTCVLLGYRTRSKCVRRKHVIDKSPKPC